MAAILGAMTLQGPHQVAMQSRTRREGSVIAVSKAALLLEAGEVSEDL